MNNCRVRQYQSLCSCGCAAYCEGRVCCDSVSRCGDCSLSIRQRKDRMPQFLSQRECVAIWNCKDTRETTQKLDTTLCPDGMSGSLKSRSTSEPHQIKDRTRGSLHSPCSRVPKCFRPLHTFVGLIHSAIHRALHNTVERT